LVRPFSIGVIEAAAKGHASGDGDSAYRAVQKVVDLSWVAARRTELADAPQKTIAVQFVVPLIVVQGALVRAVHRPGQAEFDVVPVAQGHLIHAVPPKHTRVDIVTEAYLPQYLDALLEDVSRWAKQAVSTIVRLERKPDSKFTDQPVKVGEGSFFSTKTFVEVELPAHE